MYVIYSRKRPRLDQAPAASLDADDPLESEDSSDDDSDDDTAALLAELNRIKKERASDQARKVSRFVEMLLCCFWVVQCLHVLLHLSCRRLKNDKRRSGSEWKMF